MADALVVLNPLNESNLPPVRLDIVNLNPAAQVARWREQFDDVLVHSRSPRTRAAYRSHSVSPGITATFRELGRRMK